MQPAQKQDLTHLEKSSGKGYTDKEAGYLHIPKDPQNPSPHPSPSP